MQKKQQTTVEYSKCFKCGGLVTKIVETKKGKTTTRSSCRTCGTITTRVGKGPEQKLGGSGAYLIFYKGSEIQDFGSLNSDLKREDLNENIALLSNDPLIDLEKTYISMVENGEILAIFGHLPPSYDQELEASKEQKEEKIISTEELDSFFKEIFPVEKKEKEGE